MKMTFDVTYADGSKERVVAHPRTLVAYESAHRKPLTGNPDITAVMWLSWHAAGSPDGAFTTWLDRVDDVDFGGGDDEEDIPFGTPPSP